MERVMEQVLQTQQLPDQRLLYGAWKASRCDLKGPKFKKFYVDNRLATCQIGVLSLDWNTWNRLWNLCLKQTGPLHTYVLASFVFSTLSDLLKVSFIAGRAASYVKNEAFVQFINWLIQQFILAPTMCTHYCTIRPHVQPIPRPALSTHPVCLW